MEADPEAVTDRRIRLPRKTSCIRQQDLGDDQQTCRGLAVKTILRACLCDLIYLRPSIELHNFLHHSLMFLLAFCFRLCLHLLVNAVMLLVFTQSFCGTHKVMKVCQNLLYDIQRRCAASSVDFRLYGGA